MKPSNIKLRILVLGASVAISMQFAPVRTTAGEPPDPVDFTDAPIYEIGEIPFYTVWHGQEIKFRVRATALGSGAPVAAGYVEQPSGTIFFDSGDFYYRPGPQDKSEFTVTFLATSGASHLEQIVPIQPIPLLPPEGDLLGVERKGVPDPTSKDYLVINDLKDIAETRFNHEMRRLRNVTISGKEIVLRQGHANRLFETFSGNEDIREFKLVAENIVVASAFHIPSAKMVVHGRELEFQDIGGEFASFSTEPPLFPTPPAVFTAGANGLPAGDIELIIDTFKVPEDGAEQLRFILRGGRGQDGGPGQDGSEGRSVRLVPSSLIANSSASAKATCTALVQYKNDGGWFDDSDWRLYLGPDKISGPDDGDFNTDSQAIARANNLRTRWVPTSGTPARGAGQPGAGGKGGSIRTNRPELLGFCLVAGGDPGTAGAYKGGPAGTPTVARFYRTQESAAGRNTVATLLEEIKTSRGTDAPAPTAAAGPAGALEGGSTMETWLSPGWLRQVVNHAKDAYLEGELEFTARTVNDYLARLDDLRESPEWDSVSPDDQRDFQLLEEEMRLMGHRLANGLDYFGNPPGWVPLLSLEANKLAFEQEIDRAIGILYLEYWLSDVGSTLHSKIGALTDARVQLAAESEKLARDYEVANNLIPQLDGRVEALDRETIAVQADLKLLEESLLKQAEANAKGPVWKRVARGLARVAKMVPVPWVQAVGAGLDAVAKFDPKAPWESIQGIADVVTKYKAGGFARDAKALNETYKKIKFPDLPNRADASEIKDFVNDLQKTSKPIVGRLTEVQQAFEGNQAPKSQIEAELARLKAESKDFKQLGDRISSLIAEKETFVQQLAQTMQLLGGMSENITGNLLAMDALNEDYALASGALDDRALMYLKEIGRRARERLLLYHYYVKKAYEYRLLRPYPGRLDLQKMFEQFKALAELAKQDDGEYRYQQLTGEQFRELRGLYDDALGELIKEVVVEYNKNAPALSGPRRLELTADELERLNNGEEVRLDLRTIGGTGAFPKSEEELRIASVEVLRLGIEPVSSPLAWEEVTLFVEHGGASTIRTSAGNRARSYHFVHYAEDSEVPVQWGARYFPSGGDLFPITRSLSADSLLGALLQKSGSDPAKAGYFTYLGALTELRLKREQTASAGHDLRLTEVVLQFQYEFVRRRSLSRSLDFHVNDGLAPYVEISNEDLGGRQDGFGSFTRIFETGASVTIGVPDRMGNLRFVGFEGLDTGRSISLASHGEAITLLRDVRPASRRLASDFDGFRHLLTVNLDTDLTVAVRYEPIENLELKIIRNDLSELPSLRLHLDGERWTPYQLEQAPTLEGPWSLIDEGVLMGPREEALAYPLEREPRYFRLRP